MDRIMGVLTLKAPVYRQIAEDKNATTTAGIIVVVMSVIGGILAGVIESTMVPNGSFLGALIRVILATLIGWGIGSFVLGIVANMLGGKTDTGEMLRVFGYTQIFQVLNIIPFCGAFAAFILSIIAAVIGIREAAEVSTGKAIVVGIVGFIVLVIVYLIIGFVLGALGLLPATGLIPGAR